MEQAVFDTSGLGDFFGVRVGQSRQMRASCARCGVAGARRSRRSLLGYSHPSCLPVGPAPWRPPKRNPAYAGSLGSLVLLRADFYFFFYLLLCWARPLRIPMCHLRSALLYKQCLCQQLSPAGVITVLQPRRFSNVTERTFMRAGEDEFVIDLCIARGGWRASGEGSVKNTDVAAPRQCESDSRQFVSD